MSCNILKQVLKETKQIPKPLCVFDLDSTLICVSERTRKILQTAASHEDFKHWKMDFLKEVVVKPTDFRLKDILQRASLDLSDKQYRSLFKFWGLHFFSNSFLKYDSLYKGVQNYLKLLSEHTHIMYLTARSRKRMGEGTYEQIKKWNLPLKKESDLIMKPNDYTEDAFYKRTQLERLVQEYKNIWFFENDPVIINHVNRFLPQIQIIFMQSASSKHQSLQKSFPTIGMDYSL